MAVQAGPQIPTNGTDQPQAAGIQLLEIMVFEGSPGTPVMVINDQLLAAPAPGVTGQPASSDVGGGGTRGYPIGG